MAVVRVKLWGSSGFLNGLAVPEKFRYRRFALRTCGGRRRARPAAQRGAEHRGDVGSLSYAGVQVAALRRAKKLHTTSTMMAPTTAPTRPAPSPAWYGNESAGYAERRGEDEARRLVGAGVQEFRDDAGNETDDDQPENAHGSPPECVRARKRRRWNFGSGAAAGTSPSPAESPSQVGFSRLAHIVTPHWVYPCRTAGMCGDVARACAAKRKPHGFGMGSPWASLVPRGRNRNGRHAHAFLRRDRPSGSAHPIRNPGEASP